jgi:hypothetical protein
MRRLAIALGLMLPALALAGVASAMVQSVEEPFPHEEHEGLFPLCTGCHEGIPTGDRAASFPDEASCSNCHDGVREDEVEWRVPEATASIVSFSHQEHIREVAEEGGAALACADCHVTPGELRMAVDGNPPERCLDCHSDPDPAPVHLQGAECTVCHVPLARAGLTGEAMALLPAPDGHEGDPFILEAHGEEATADVARCATCHVQDQCAQCHVNAGLSPIPDVPAAPSDMPFVAIEAHYPVPESHGADDFLLGHGEGIVAAECTTCHTQNDCAACHVGPAVEPVPSLPTRETVRAPGVQVARAMPGSHESPFFMDAHAPMASAGAGGCATCHAQTDCVACHDAPRSSAFHPEGFQARHAADAYAQTAECASCHSTQIFCRSCHQESGFGSFGRLGSGFHDAEPAWLFRHGQAARQTLESCVSCHEQRDCTQCHGALGAFKVSPHGPDFDPERARSKNPVTCRACHVGAPGGGDR